MNADAVFVGAKIKIVPNVNGVNQESKFLRKLLSDAFNSAEKISTLARIDQWNQPIANLKTNLIEAGHIVPTELVRFGLGIGFRCRFDHFRHQPFLRSEVTRHSKQRSNREKDQVRHAGNNTHGADNAGRYVQHLRVVSELLGDLGAHVLLTRDPGDNDGGCR